MIRPVKYLLIPLLYLFLTAISFRAISQASDFSFRHYTTDHGLSSDQTTCIFKDRQGYMWFGTINGLNRFDGIQFTVYKRKEGGLPGNYIIGINQSPDGWLWISTHKGICRFNPSTEVFEPLALPNNTDERGDNDFVSGMVLDGKGYGWFTTPDHLYRIHLITKQLTTYPPASQDPHPILTYLYMDSHEQLWGLRAGALYRFNPQTKQYIYTLGQDSQHQDSQLHVNTLYEDSQKQLWAATLEHGLFRYDDTKQTFADEPDGNTWVHTIVEDWLPDGRSFLWAGKGSEVLAVYDPATRQYIPYKHDFRDDLSHNGGGIVQFYRDPQNGIVWMATTHGIQKKDPFEIKFKRKLVPHQQENGQNTQVRFVQQDKNIPSQYWLGLSGDGLMRWDRPANTFIKIQPKPKQDFWNVYDLLQQENGHMWLASDNALIHWNPVNDQWEHKRDFFITPKAYQSVTSLLQDHSGQIWIGSSHDGLFVMNPETGSIKPWPLADTIGVGNPLGVYRLAMDHLNRLWVSTNRGIFRIQATASQTEQIQLHPLSKQILPSDRLQSSLFIDSKNRLWVSGIGFLAQADLDGQVSTIYTLENGLEADHIFSIAEDQSGRLWMTTDNLMHRLDTKTGTFAYFRKENGLFANNSGSQLTKDSNGELFVGFTSAFNHFIPEQLLYNKQAPAAVLTEVKVDNEKRGLPEKSLSISPDENTLSVAFAGLNYSLPEKNQYAFKLEGFDKDWTLTDQRNATYTNLSPGSYSFRVKVANNDGIWNENGTALAIRVIPPFWQTWWFVLLITGVLAAIILAIYWYRENNRQKLEAIRNRIATDLHDDMGSTLSSIRIFSDVVQRQIAPVQPDVIPILQRISASATGLSESMQDIIWTIQTKHDSLEDVVTRMREFGLKIAEAKGIDFRMQVSDKFQSTRLSVEQRRNLYLIFKESINNAVKYADCTQIQVLLEVNGKNLHLRISDNGKGFDPATVRQGNGLQNLQKRAGEIHGKLTLTAAPGAGTSIELHTKLSL